MQHHTMKARGALGYNSRLLLLLLLCVRKYKANIYEGMHNYYKPLFVFVPLSGGIHIDMRRLNKIKMTNRQGFDTELGEGPALELGPGSTWARVLKKVAKVPLGMQ